VGAEFPAESAARERFREIASRDDADIDLAEGALWIAADGRPEVDVSAGLAALARIADEVGPLAGALEERVDALNRSLFEVQGFRGSRDDYYDPRNSFLDQVLARKTGIPITLCVVYIEVARRLGLEAFGINFPGHFLTRVGAAPIIVDAFEGRVATRAECETRLEAVVGRGAQLTDEQLAPAGNKSVLLRMLSNLKSIHVARRDFESALGCCDRSLLLAPDSASELRDRGLLYHGLECPRPALMDLERYLELDPEGEGSQEIRKLVGRLHGELPPLH
jgi:regulator of sirC expression with transglutaminase-like and TPR domain